MEITSHFKSWVLYLVAPIIISLMLVSCGSDNGQKTNRLSILAVEVSQPIQKKITEWNEFTGRFEATDRVEVRARVSGYIESVKFKDGQFVNKGDVLFIIDQRPYRIALAEVQAAYGQSQSDLKQATDNFNRVESLKESGAVSIEEYDRRQQSMASAQARLQVAQAAVDNAKLNLEFTRVTAPLSGRIGRDLINAGNLISGGTANSTLLTTIVSISPIHFYFTESEADFLQYSRQARNGDRSSSRDNPVPIEVRLSDEIEFTHSGSMDFVNNEIGKGTGTIEARAIFENKDGVLEPGMFGRARVQGRSEYEVLMVPDALISTNQTVKYVFTVGADSIAKVTPLVLGGLYQNKYRIVKSGLSPKDRVVITNTQKVRPDTKVAFTESDVLHKESMTLVNN